MTQTPPGWHPAPDQPGQLRYWDGAGWTEHYAPAEPPAPTNQSQTPDGLPTLWEAKGKPLSSVGGGRYRLTAHYLYFERGTLRTDSQQVPVSQLLDVDVRQSMAQKARGVGTMLVHINRGSSTETVQIVDVPNFREGQHAVNQAAAEARSALQRAQNTMRYEGQPQFAPQQSAPAPVAAPSQPDLMAQLEQLGKLRDAGVLSEDEFATKKADILSRI